MIKVFFLIFEPGAAWEKIAQARRGIFFITVVHLLPLLLLVTAVESWGLQTHGKWQPKFQRLRDFSTTEIINYETIQFIALLAMVFICAALVFKISRTFQERQNFLPAFTAVAYGFSPMFLLRLPGCHADHAPGDHLAHRR